MNLFQKIFITAFFILCSFISSGADLSTRDIIRFNYEDLGDDPLGNCREYSQGTSFSPLSSMQKIQGCLNKWIDKNLAPICEHEQKLYDLLDHYEQEGNESGISTVENEIRFNED